MAEKDWLPRCPECGIGELSYATRYLVVSDVDYPAVECSSCGWDLEDRHGNARTLRAKVRATKRKPHWYFVCLEARGTKINAVVDKHPFQVYNFNRGDGVILYYNEISRAEYELWKSNVGEGSVECGK